MPRGLNNWNFNDVVRFLKANGFKRNHTRGSHFYYVKEDKNKTFQVRIPFHGAKSIKPKTMKGIISQSGISQKDWLSGRKKKN